MAIIIGSNRSQLYGKIILQPILLGIVFLFGYPLVDFGFANAKVFFVLFPFLVFVLFVLFNLVQLIYLPIKLYIEDSGTLTIQFLLRKPRMIMIDEVESFNFTQVSTRFTLYDGIIINLKKKKKILVSDFNVKNYLPVRQHLENSTIPFLGKINFKLISYYRNAI